MYLNKRLLMNDQLIKTKSEIRSLIDVITEKYTVTNEEKQLLKKLTDVHIMIQNMEDNVEIMRLDNRNIRIKKYPKAQKVYNLGDIITVTIDNNNVNALVVSKELESGILICEIINGDYKGRFYEILYDEIYNDDIYNEPNEYNKSILYNY